MLVELLTGYPGCADDGPLGYRCAQLLFSAGAVALCGVRDEKGVPVGSVLEIAWYTEVVTLLAKTAETLCRCVSSCRSVSREGES